VDCVGHVLYLCPVDEGGVVVCYIFFAYSFCFCATEQPTTQFQQQTFEKQDEVGITRFTRRDFILIFEGLGRGVMMMMDQARAHRNRVRRTTV
jgi:hypothetical protein